MKRVLAGFVVVLWLLELWYAAELLVGDPSDPAERLRAGLGLAVGIGFALAAGITTRPRSA